MPGVPLKHSTHPPLSLPLDALLSLFSLPPSPPPPCRRQPSSDRRIPPRPDYSTNDQFIFVSFTIRIRCSFSLLSSFATKRLFGACIDLPVHATATGPARCGRDTTTAPAISTRLLSPRITSTKRAHCIGSCFRYVASASPNFWYLNHGAGASELWLQETRPFVLASCPARKSTAWRMRMGSLVAPYISNPD